MPSGPAANIIENIANGLEGDTRRRENERARGRHARGEGAPAQKAYENRLPPAI